MKNIKTEYIITNVLSNISEAEHKEKINKAIRTLCVLDIEKSGELVYNEDVAFRGGFWFNRMIYLVLPSLKKSYF